MLGSRTTSMYRDPRQSCFSAATRHHAPIQSVQRYLKMVEGRRRCVSVTKAVFQANTGAWVAPPRGGAARGVVHFLGGAFAGAAPHIIYSLFVDLLAEAGYTVVSTPYAVTFRHEDCARAMHRLFHDTVDELRTSNPASTFSSAGNGRSSTSARNSAYSGVVSGASGISKGHSAASLANSYGAADRMASSSYARGASAGGGSSFSALELARPGAEILVPEGVPVFGVGHSNGALLHLLLGSYFPNATASNVIISFNNKQVADAIPIPGLLGTLSPSVQMARRSPLPFQLPFGSAAELLSTAATALSPVLSEEQRMQLARSGLALDQLGLVVDEVRFVEDTIDETPSMAALLRRQNPAGITSLTLPGSHVTPCGGELPWQAGQTFTALDAFAQRFRTASQVDVRRLARQVIGWLDSNC